MAVRHVLLWMIGGMLVSSAQAISYREWASLPSQEVSPISIVLEPAATSLVHETTTTIEVWSGNRRQHHKVPKRPLGGYLGQIIIQQREGVRLQYPLTLTLLFPSVEKDDLLPLAESSEAVAFHLPMGLLNPDAPLRAARFRRNIRLDTPTSSGRITVPLLLSNIYERRGLRLPTPNILSCLCEVSDARGTVLARKQLVELYNPNGYVSSEDGAWVMNEPEADRYLRENAGINRLLTVTEIPTTMEPYTEIDALWLSAEAVRSVALTPAMLRRLILMGVWIYGRAETVSNLVGAAGLDGPGAVLMGGIQAPVEKVERGRSRPHTYGQAFGSPAFYPDRKNTNAVPVMNNQNDLFDPLKRRYLGWTISILSLFFAVACIGMPVAFWRLKGSRRLILWWLIPAVTVVISVVGLVGGGWFLPRQSRCDITEYRFAVAGWPEVFCHSVNRLLTFEDREVNWKLPRQSFTVPMEHHSLFKGFAHRQWIDETPDFVMHGSGGLKRGQISVNETAFFRSLPIPVAINQTTNPPKLKALVPLHQVHVWEHGAWYKLGTLAPGQAVDWSHSAKTHRFLGIPERISECFPSYHYKPDQVPCKNCGKIHEGDKDMAEVFSNRWVVAALATEPAEVQPMFKNAQVESRVVWFIHIPLDTKAGIHGKNLAEFHDAN